MSYSGVIFHAGSDGLHANHISYKWACAYETVPELYGNEQNHSDSSVSCSVRQQVRTLYGNMFTSSYLFLLTRLHDLLEVCVWGIGICNLSMYDLFLFHTYNSTILRRSFATQVELQLQLACVYVLYYEAVRSKTKLS
jgi:cellulose synthase/poly-beta-1,6-N-acetylglucosamine synthase-like glycosyltransferase